MQSWWGVKGGCNPPSFLLLLGEDARGLTTRLDGELALSGDIFVAHLLVGHGDQVIERHFFSRDKTGTQTDRNEGRQEEEWKVPDTTVFRDE